jgi:hypothetical protein
MNEIVTYKEVEERVIEIRGQKVLLDSSVAELYGVETMRVNEAVKNNPDKFPDSYIFELSKEEKQKVIENFDNPKVKFSPSLPKAFTEKGLYMLATILKSPKAVTTTIAIVETFAKIRELKETFSLVPSTKEESQKKELMQRGGEILMDILDNDDALEVSGDETTIEIDLAFVKLKHTVKRNKRDK